MLTLWCPQSLHDLVFFDVELEAPEDHCLTKLRDGIHFASFFYKFNPNLVNSLTNVAYSSISRGRHIDPLDVRASEHRVDHDACCCRLSRSGKARKYHEAELRAADKFTELGG